MCAVITLAPFRATPSSRSPAPRPDPTGWCSVPRQRDAGRSISLDVRWPGTSLTVCVLICDNHTAIREATSSAWFAWDFPGLAPKVPRLPKNLSSENSQTCRAGQGPLTLHAHPGSTAGHVTSCKDTCSLRRSRLYPPRPTCPQLAFLLARSPPGAGCRWSSQDGDESSEGWGRRSHLVRRQSWGCGPQGAVSPGPGPSSCGDHTCAGLTQPGVGV